MQNQENVFVRSIYREDEKIVADVEIQIDYGDFVDIKDIINYNNNMMNRVIQEVINKIADNNSRSMNIDIHLDIREIRPFTIRCSLGDILLQEDKIFMNKIFDIID